MEATFFHPWFVLAAVALAVAGGAVGFLRRKAAPMLFVLGAASFLLAGARPQIGVKPADVRHALVIDVSGSMATRPEVTALAASLQLPAGHSFARFELSDALRASGSPRGEITDYARLADITSDASITGEIVLITDGRGELGELYSAVDPRRLILLRAPQPASPDASILSLTAPTSVPTGGAVTLRATIRCDADAVVPWRLLDASNEIGSGKVSVRADVPAVVAHTHTFTSEGLQRLTLRLEFPVDREPRNDEASLAFMTGSKRRIDYCLAKLGSDVLLQLLQSDAGNEVRVRFDLPAAPGELTSADLVVINNLSLADSGVAREQLVAIAEWVNSGGRVLMLGTGGAFGPGGYRGAAIEEVMPVRFRPEDTPPRRVLLLLDTSASMGESLSGGATRLGRLKEGARRVSESLGESDLAAVLGFRESVQGEALFLPARDERLATRINELAAQGSTHIATSLEGALQAFKPGDTGGSILMVTDGEDVEAARAERYHAIGASLAGGGIRLDIVLTDSPSRPWTDWLHAANPEVHVWQAGDFDDLLETLDQAVADGDQEWVVTLPLAVNGIPTPLPRLVRTAPRTDSSATVMLSATAQSEPPRTYPLLARRQLVGRTACLCTDSWGDAALAAFWGDTAFQAEINGMLDFLLENTGAQNLVLNPLGDGAELVWTGQLTAPEGDLGTSAGVARRDRPGRWLLETWPAGDRLQVFNGDSLLQTIALPQLVPLELQRTGDDAVFFEVATEGGIRVFGSLDGWQPRRFIDTNDEPQDVTWAAALLGMLLLLAGFALRRK